MSPSARTVALCVSLAAIGLSGCGGGDSADNAGVRQAHLYQASPGDVPVIRMGWTPSSGTDTSKIVAWLIYRAASWGLAAEPTNLIAVQEVHGSLDYVDQQSASLASTFSRSFTYFRLGEQETGSVDITYDRPGLVSGQSYYYRARLVVKPHSGASPLSTTAASSFEVDPPDALTDASTAQGPVTYFGAPAPTAPPHGSTGVDPRYVQFRWSTVTGADEYQIRVYATSTATGTPVLQSPEIRPTGSNGVWIYDAGSSAALVGGRAYYWVVGARAAGETEPACGTEVGWLRGPIRQFTTVSLPPGV